MKRLTLIVWICTISAVVVKGQTRVMSLDSCVVYAMEHNCDILLQDNAESLCRVELLKSKMDLLPSLNIHLNQYYNWGRSVDMQELVIVRNRLTCQTSGSIGASFTIFDGLAGINNLSRQEQLARAAHCDGLQARLDVKTDIAASYLANILARLSRQRLLQSLDNATQMAERIAAQAECGARDRSDCMEIAARIADIQAQIAAAESDESLAMAQLKAYMGCEDVFMTDTCVTIPRDLDVYATVFNPAGMTPPAVAASRSRIKAAEYGIRAATGAMMPSLSISAAYGTYYSDASPDIFKEQLDGNRNPSVSLSLVVPILNGGSQYAAVARARAELQQNELRLRQAAEQASLFQSRLSSECHSLREQMLASRAKCDFCRVRLKEATERHSSGTLSTSEWIETLDTCTQAECDYVQCLCKYLYQLKIIEYYRDGCR